MTATDRQADRRAYLDTDRIQRALTGEARGMHAVVVSTTPNPEFGRYAEQRAAILRRGYERMGVELADLADDARAEAAELFTHLTGEPA